MVPVFVHVIFAPPAVLVGVRIMVRLVPVAVVAPVVTVMTPSVIDVTVVMFFVTAGVGTPFAPALQPVRVPISALHNAIPVLTESNSAIAPAALARDV